MKKRVHMIANAHIDPVWLWRWEEGCTEALSTFGTAADLVDEFDEFRFNHNESILYDWVKNNNPILFDKMKQQVKDKKWEIIGGWYIQPDCNMPAGESIVRNILLGKQFFKENFNECPTTAVNFDSFGHSRGLVQILVQAGYDKYLVFRPDQSNFDFEDADFVWEGLNNTSVTVHRSDEGYNSVWGEATQELKKFLKKRETEEVTLYLWGVGDHGGGPTRKDLNDFRQEMKESEYEIIHSTPDAYFKELKETGKELKRVARGLNPVAQGCYTSQIRVKQKHRQLENEIYSTEKMASAAALQYQRPYAKEAFKEAIKSLVFAEFHDALPGTGTKNVEDDTLRLLDHGLELMSREKLYAAIALAQGEPKVIPDTSVIMFYNPHPFDITGVFECETGLPKQNWNSDFLYPEVEFNGVKIPTQGEKESSNFGIDWRKKVVVQAEFKAFSMNRLNVSFKSLEARPEFDDIIQNKYFDFSNQSMSVKINTRTGLIDDYKVNGISCLEKNSFQLVMKDDSYNPWGLGTGESACERIFQLLTPHEGSSFCGLNREVVPSVRVIEDGPVRTVVEAVFGINNSWAYLRYKLPKQGTAFEVDVMVQNNEKEQSLKLVLNTKEESSQNVTGQIMFGREKYETPADEVVAQKWVMVCNEENDQSLLVINNGTYGLNYEDNKLGISLLRSAGYTAADDNKGKALSEKQHAPRMEQGERFYSFVIDGGSTKQMKQRVDNQALIFNEKPYGFAYCPPGIGEKKESFIRIDNTAIVVSALKKAEESEEYVIRLYESSGRKQVASILIPEFQINQSIEWKPDEVKTFIIDTKNNKLVETTIVEGM